MQSRTRRQRRSLFLVRSRSHDIEVRPTLLSPERAARLASAFELSERDVQADARVIVEWSQGPERLTQWLNERHGWRTDEAYYFVRWVRLQVWVSEDERGGQ
jgi:hypothetical protein